MELLNQHVN